MDKPITMVIDELKEDLVGAINKSHLPMWVVSTIMADMLREVNNLATQQSVEERKAYEESLKEAEND